MSGTTQALGVVIGRVIARGTLRLESAAHFGGDEGDETDMTLVRGADGALVIPGASIAGACRGYLAHCLLGARAFGYLSPRDESPPSQQRAEERRLWAQEAQVGLIDLFGGIDDNGNQSALLVADAYASHETTGIRDGVAITGATGQAADTAKYDAEVIEPGGEFLLCFELVIRQIHADEGKVDLLKRLLNLVLEAFERGELRLGARTRRGLGRGRVDVWQVQDLRFGDPQDVLRWLRREQPQGDSPRRTTVGDQQASRGVLSYLDLRVTVTLDGPLLVRSYTEDPYQPDAVQLRAGGMPVIPGTSIAGVLRHRAERILHTIVDGHNDEAVQGFIEHLFGHVHQRGNDDVRASQRASRLRIEEEMVQDARAEIQARVRIDRVTGGVLTGALFDEEPVWGERGQPMTWRLTCRLWEPEEAEIGLLLHLLKDVWLGDVTVGGGAAVGRGVLHGKEATLAWVTSGEERGEWTIRGAGETTPEALRLVGSDPHILDRCAESLLRRMGSAEG